MLQEWLHSRLSFMNIFAEDVHSQFCTEKGLKNAFLSTIWINEDHYARKKECVHLCSKNGTFSHFHHALLLVGLLLVHMPSYTFKLSPEGELLANY